MRTLVIIPTYNEAENIGKLLADLWLRYKSSVDLLVVDDASPDGTAAIVQALQPVIEGLHLIVRAEKSGLGTAYLTGFSYALSSGYGAVIEMDADYSHDPAVIGRFLEGIEQSDLMIGSRYLNNTVNVVNWPISRLILSKLAAIYTRMITGMPVDDPTSGFACIRADMLRKLDLQAIHSQGYSFQIELKFRIWKHGGRIREIPIVFTDRSVGKSKMSQQHVAEAVLVVWMLAIRSRLRLL